MMELSGQLHATADLPLGRKNPRYPLVNRLGAFQDRSGRCGTEKNMVTLRGIELGCVDRNPPLYRMNCPDSQAVCIVLRSPRHEKQVQGVQIYTTSCFTHTLSVWTNNAETNINTQQQKVLIAIKLCYFWTPLCVVCGLHKESTFNALFYNLQRKSPGYLKINYFTAAIVN
jgi:hypothetical protein